MTPALLTVLIFCAGGPVLIWVAQTATLWVTGDPHPVAWPFRHPNESEAVRLARKLALQATLIGSLVAVPWAAGEDFHGYLAARIGPPHWRLLAEVMAGAMFMLGTLLLICRAAGWVRVTAHYGWGKSINKVIRGSLTPLPLAVMEEAVFRGLILEQLLRAFPASEIGQSAAIVLSAFLFSSVHFIRPQKQLIFPWIGLFGLGMALGWLYIAGGHTLWLPVALHAGGVWYVQTSRPFVSYDGPGWLVGYRSYPICGLLGMACMGVTTVWAASLVG
jgi:membrane protease YdiL (CAAX protease family)